MKKTKVFMTIIICLTLSLIIFLLLLSGLNLNGRYNERGVRIFAYKIIMSINNNTDFYKQNCESHTLEAIEGNRGKFATVCNITVQEYEPGSYFYRLEDSHGEFIANLYISSFKGSLSLKEINLY